MYCFLIKIGNKFCKIVYLCTSPSLFHGEFETFTDSLELTLDKVFETNSFLVIAFGDFHGNLSQWYQNDKTTTERTVSQSFVFPLCPNHSY